MKNELIKFINQVCGVDISRKKRERMYVLGRMVYVKICKRNGLTLKDIGININVHHSSVIYLDRQFDLQVDYDTDLMSIMTRVESKFKTNDVMDEIYKINNEIASLQSKVKKLKLKL